MIGVAGSDKFVERVGAIVVRFAVDEPSLDQREPRARVPGAGTGAAGLVALDAVDRKIRAHAVFETHGGIARVGKPRQCLRRGNRGVEITGLAQYGELIAAETVQVRTLIQLARVETQGVSAGGCVAGEARAARWNLDLLRDGVEADLHRQEKVRTAVRNEVSLRACIVPR